MPINNIYVWIVYSNTLCNSYSKSPLFGIYSFWYVDTTVFDSPPPQECPRGTTSPTGTAAGTAGLTPSSSSQTASWLSSSSPVRRCKRAGTTPESHPVSPSWTSWWSSYPETTPILWQQSYPAPLPPYSWYVWNKYFLQPPVKTQLNKDVNFNVGFSPAINGTYPRDPVIYSRAPIIWINWDGGRYG
jgi:hypothetical protein